MTDPPAVARRRVRVALRKAREARSLTQGQIAEAMDWSLSKVMRIEKGEVSVSPTDLRVLLPFLGITDGEEVARLVEDAKTARRERWLVDAHERELLGPAMAELVQFEAQATAIRYFSLVVIPSLLQTVGYASAIFENFVLDLDEDTIKTRIKTRMERQQRVLFGPSPPEYLVMLDESVLYREVGTAAVMVEQFRAIQQLIKCGKAMVRILPFGKPAAYALVGPFVILDLPDDRNAVVYRERYLSDEIVHSETEIKRHRDVFERLWPLAYDDVESTRLFEERIEAMVTSMRRGRPS